MNKKDLLGLDPGTASNRLVKNLLFDYVVKAGYVCFRCGLPLTRDTFSIEHKEPWMIATNPLDAFFDLDNIAYSHKLCNSLAARRKLPKHGTEHMYNKYGCRCDTCITGRSAYRKSIYTKETRRRRYQNQKNKHQGVA